MMYIKKVFIILLFFFSLHARAFISSDFFKKFAVANAAGISVALVYENFLSGKQPRDNSGDITGKINNAGAAGSGFVAASAAFTMYSLFLRDGGDCYAKCAVFFLSSCVSGIALMVRLTLLPFVLKKSSSGKHEEISKNYEGNIFPSFFAGVVLSALSMLAAELAPKISPTQV